MTSQPSCLQSLLDQGLLPAAAWVVNPLWQEAQWSATAYQFDRAGEFPPILGLVFENPAKGRELFRNWVDEYGNSDELEEIRITIIEGSVAGERPGYFVHISPDPDNSLVRATAEGIVIDEIPLALLGQIQWMDRNPVTTPMLPRFKELFEQHGEFLFAPASLRDDGNHWVDLECGIVKTAVHFRNLAEIEQQFSDAVKAWEHEFSAQSVRTHPQDSDR